MADDLLATPPGATADPATAKPAEGGGDATSAGDSGVRDTPAKSPGAWIEDIADEDLRKRVGKFAGKPVSELAKAYAHAEGLIGSDPASLVKLDEAAAADPTGILRRLGLPDTPDGYKIDGLPEGTMTEKDLAWFKDVAHKNGLLPKQADALLKATIEMAANQQTLAAAAMEDAAKKDVDILRQTHGKDFDNIVAAAKLAANDLGIREVLSEAGLGTNPKIIEALAKIGAGLRDGAGPNSGPAKGVGAAEAAEIGRNLKAQQLAAIRAGDNVKADQLQKEIDQYYQRAYG